jgi:uncharacterized protein YndB with AHSA1/START domain/DNA-binding transcriptional ArsR family regulator
MQVFACIIEPVPDEGQIFKALADPTRRHLLDRLRENNGQTLGELCDRVGMTRQSVSQHLDLLEDASLISTVRRGREKFHYLNPVPIYQIQERWIARFERPRLLALGDIKRLAEEKGVTDKPSFVYVTYVRSTPVKVWDALTDPELTAEYWGHSNVSDWQAGSAWEHQRTDRTRAADVAGKVLESSPPWRLVMTWSDPGADTDDPSIVTFDIEPYEDIVRLTVTHENLAGEADCTAKASGWAAVISNLKSFIETGHALPQAPWEMPATSAATAS